MNNILGTDAELIFAHSRRSDGSMMTDKKLQIHNVRPFLSAYNIPFEKTHFMKQIHGNKIVLIDEHSPQIIEEADGLITTKKDSFLGVVTADCLPVLFYDQKNLICGAVHAGYKGLLEGVLDSWITYALSLGSDPKDIEVYIGPSIHGCCYNVTQERAEKFVLRYGNEDRIVRYNGDMIFLKLQEVAKINLENLGILPKNISMSTHCTSCNVDIYFSYRQDSSASFGELLSVIGMQE
jgi:YfiH family protein